MLNSIIFYRFYHNTIAYSRKKVHPALSIIHQRFWRIIAEYLFFSVDSHPNIIYNKPAIILRRKAVFALMRLNAANSSL